MATNAVPKSDLKKLSIGQKLARLIFIIALIGLMVTGLPQKFALQNWSNFLITMLGGIESARILHRFFVIVLIVAVVYHVLELGYSWFVLRKRPGLMPTLRDWRMQFARIVSSFGASNQEPSRFSAPLKIEYLVIVVSVIILGITGAVLLNPILVSDVLPGSVIPFSRSIHSDHALLFTGFVIIWRIGIFFWRPKRVSQSTSTDAEGHDKQQLVQRQRVYAGISVIAIVVFIGLAYAYLTAETTAISTVARQEVLVFAPEFVPTEGNPDVGQLVWSTHRCAFCHGPDAEGIVNSGPSLPTDDMTFESFVVQVRNGSDQMPAFSSIELPESQLVHLWAWLEQLQ